MQTFSYANWSLIQGFYLFLQLMLLVFIYKLSSDVFFSSHMHRQ